MNIASSLAFANAVRQQQETKEVQSIINCPLCGEELTHKQVGETHIYTCEPCPFIGFEYISDQNLFDLMVYLARNSVTELEMMANIVLDVCKIYHKDREKMQENCNDIEGDDK